MKHVEKNSCFRNFYLFIQRGRNIAIIQDDKHVRNIFFTCLKEIAF